MHGCKKMTARRPVSWSGKTFSVFTTSIRPFHGGKRDAVEMKASPHAGILPRYTTVVLSIKSIMHSACPVAVAAPLSWLPCSD